LGQTKRREERKRELENGKTPRKENEESTEKRERRHRYVLFSFC